MDRISRAPHPDWPTRDAAENAFRAMLDEECRRKGVGDSDAFRIQLWNEGGTRRPEWHATIHRAVHFNEALDDQSRRLRHVDADTRSVIRDMISRMTRVNERVEAVEQVTDCSEGDPYWTMSCHRLVAEIIELRGIEGRQHSWTYLRDAIRSRMPLSTFRIDAGRMHPVGLRISRKGEAPVVTMGVATSDADPRTTIMTDMLVPEVVMAAATGRSLKDVIDIEGVSDGHRIHSMVRDEVNGTTVKLEHDDVFLVSPPAGRSRPWSRNEASAGGRP